LQLQLGVEPAGAIPPRPQVASIGGGLRAQPGVPVSVAVHIALIAAAALAIVHPRLPARLPIESIEVELLSDGPAMVATPEMSTTEETSAAPEEDGQPISEGPGRPGLLAHALTLYSDTIDATARASLVTLGSDARLAQICGIEAMEQIARHQKTFTPELTVTDATTDAKVAGNVMIAEGAAFLSKGRWYRLSFRCQTTAGRLKVLSFDYATGGPLKRARGIALAK